MYFIPLFSFSSILQFVARLFGISLDESRLTSSLRMSKNNFLNSMLEAFYLFITSPSKSSAFMFSLLLRNYFTASENCRGCFTISWSMIQRLIIQQIWILLLLFYYQKKQTLSQIFSHKLKLLCILKFPL